jgi:alpha-glucosidase (family GH31 glycosyl hydrolase)
MPSTPLVANLVLFPPAAVHPDGTSEYNAHNLYGTSMARHFHNTYKDVAGKRTFLLTRCGLLNTDTALQLLFETLMHRRF